MTFRPGVAARWMASAPRAESYEPDFLPMGQLDHLSGQRVISGRRVDGRVRELDDLIPLLAKTAAALAVSWFGLAAAKPLPLSTKMSVVRHRSSHRSTFNINFLEGARRLVTGYLHQ